MGLSSVPRSLVASGVAAVAAAVGVVIVVASLRRWLGKRPFCRGSHGGEVRRPIRAILANPQFITYQHHHGGQRPPKVVGVALKLRVWLALSKFGGAFLVPRQRVKNGIDILEGVYLPEKPTLHPTPPTSPPTEDNAHSNLELLQGLVEKEVGLGEEGGAEFRFPTIADYIRVYRSKKATPTQVVKTILAAIAASDEATPPLRAVIDSCRPVVLAMAEASTQRWEEGKTLSIMDGIPVLVKSELRVEPYEVLAGSTFVSSHLVHGLPESVIVQKLRDAGAVVLGLANVQEFGMGVTGSNPNSRHLTARNPYNPQHYTGGSSSGSASSVAAGFCPVAIGTDGGGSIRIPAALCGVVGLKPTNQSLDTTGIIPVTCSVSATGPLSSSVLDAAIALNTIARETSSEKTALTLSGLGSARLDGLKVGIYWEYFGDAEREVVACCESALKQLQNLGAELVEIKIPELESIRIAHLVTIVSEFYAALAKEVDDHHDGMNKETLAVFSYADDMSAMEYLNAQKQRTRAVEIVRYLFQEQGIDIIVTPATACPAPHIPPGAEKYGCFDVHASSTLIRFVTLANMTGIPGLVLPVGYSTAAGLPISLQLMGAWHQENLLLKVGWALEQTGAFPAKKPQVFYDVLSGSQ